MNLYLYNGHHSPITLALFVQYLHDFKDDGVTGTYQNLFDMMMANLGGILVIVAETGWPDEGKKYWQNYLIRHLQSASGKTPEGA